MMASGSRPRTSCAASPSAGAVLRAAGSAMICEGGTRGKALRTSRKIGAPVKTNVRLGGMIRAMRSSVCSRRVFGPWRRSNCFGRRRRLSGQKRVPLPPAIITA